MHFKHIKASLSPADSSLPPTTLILFLNEGTKRSKMKKCGLYLVQTHPQFTVHTLHDDHGDSIQPGRSSSLLEYNIKPYHFLSLFLHYVVLL